MATLYGNEIASNTPRRGLVFLATHRGDGSRLPLMNRSFISFSFGGKHIEDFDLIATISGDRLLRSGYAPFEDNVTNYSNLDGLYYWGTHSQANSLDLTLSTDGIELKKLDDFLYWFRAGETKELILAEHPNRAILARVAEPPQLELLPFEAQIKLNISDMEYYTSTTLYKGDISLSFTMDEPYWYSLMNILGKKDTVDGIETYTDVWEDANGNEVSIFASLDALKILYEDNIPLGTMFDENMLLGNGAYASIKNDYKSWTWPSNDVEPINWNDPNLVVYACTADSDGTVIGTIAGAIIDASGNGISELPPGPNNAGYFYYSGNAPAYTTITFTMFILFADAYVCSPSNSYRGQPVGIPYSTLTVESEHQLELKFTTPNYLTSYNKAIDIFQQALVNDSMGGSSYSPEDIRASLRDNVHHIYARSWAIHVVDTFSNNGNWASNALGTNIREEMLKFLHTELLNNGNSNTDVRPELTVTFNSLTGEAIGHMKYRDAATGNIIEAEENVGDMLRSNHLVIKDRNYPDSNFRISAWTNLNKLYSHRVYHNLQMKITNLSIIYKNMYL